MRTYPAALTTFVTAAVLLFAATGSAVAADPTTVTVSSTTTGTLSTQISTNNPWSGLIDSLPKGKANFSALNLPLVRLHIGDDGYPVAMPEVKQGQWSFTALDVLVND